MVLDDLLRLGGLQRGRLLASGWVGWLLAGGGRGCWMWVRGTAWAACAQAVGGRCCCWGWGLGLEMRWGWRLLLLQLLLHGGVGRGTAGGRELGLPLHTEGSSGVGAAPSATAGGKAASAWR